METRGPFAEALASSPGPDIPSTPPTSHRTPTLCPRAFTPRPWPGRWRWSCRSNLLPSGISLSLSCESCSVLLNSLRRVHYTLSHMIKHHLVKCKHLKYAGFFVTGFFITIFCEYTKCLRRWKGLLSHFPLCFGNQG